LQEEMPAKEKMTLLELWKENIDLLPEDATIVNDSNGVLFQDNNPAFDYKDSQFIDRQIAK